MAVLVAKVLVFETCSPSITTGDSMTHELQRAEAQSLLLLLLLQ